jgi:hypothetical protein
LIIGNSQQIKVRREKKDGREKSGHKRIKIN